MDIRKMNKKLEKENPDLYLMEGALASMKQDLEAVEVGLEETLKEADAAAEAAENDRKKEKIIDEFAAEAAGRQEK